MIAVPLSRTATICRRVAVVAAPVARVGVGVCPMREAAAHRQVK